MPAVGHEVPARDPDVAYEAAVAGEEPAVEGRTVDTSDDQRMIAVERNDVSNCTGSESAGVPADGPIRSASSPTLTAYACAQLYASNAS